MDSNTILKRKENLLSTDLDGETVLMVVDTGNYFTLNSVASVIWKLLEKPLALASLQEQLVNQFQGDRATILAETQTYIEDLATRGLVTS